MQGGWAIYISEYQCHTEEVVVSEGFYRKNECRGKVKPTNNPNQTILVLDAASPGRALVAALQMHSAESIQQSLAFRVGRIFRFDGGLHLEEQELGGSRRHDMMADGSEVVEREEEGEFDRADVTSMMSVPTTPAVDCSCC